MNINKIVGKSIAPAKINLFLGITGMRVDGYHTIETLFLPLSEPADTITISVTSEPGICITSNSSEIPLDESNICFKAAERFAKLADIKPNWSIDIQKNIPVAAGLGGGSSDAAAVLNILYNSLKRVNLKRVNLKPVDLKPVDRCKLQELALQLGADVPFFMNPSPSMATGIGEELQLIPMNLKLNMLLINPRFPVSAKWAYQRYSEIKKGAELVNNVGGELKTILNTLQYGSISELPPSIVNDLALGVYEKFPIMQLLTDQIKESGAICIGMSGSGPTIFAICEDRRSVAKLADNLKNEWGDALILIPGTANAVGS